MSGRWNHSIEWHDWIDSNMRDGATVLDIGCGDGQLLRRLANRATHCTGIDPDATSIREARDLSTDLDNITFLEGDFLTYPFDGTRFDFITAVATLHHMELEPALTRAAQLLWPDGVLVMVGCARSSGLVNAGYDVVGVVKNKMLIRQKGWWDHNAPTKDPSTTYADARRISQTTLPGCHFRRRPLFRYTVTWEQPG